MATKNKASGLPAPGQTIVYYTGQLAYDRLHDDAASQVRDAMWRAWLAGKVVLTQRALPTELTEPRRYEYLATGCRPSIPEGKAWA